MALHMGHNKGVLTLEVPNKSYMTFHAGNLTHIVAVSWLHFFYIVSTKRIEIKDKAECSVQPDLDLHWAQMQLDMKGPILKC